MNFNIKLYARVHKDFFPIAIFDINETDRTAWVSGEKSNPFFRWNTWEGMNTYHSSAHIPFSDIYVLEGLDFRSATDRDLLSIVHASNIPAPVSL